MDDVTAYMLANHKAVDIMDRETNMIEAEKIDDISEVINITLDKLLELEERHGVQ